MALWKAKRGEVQIKSSSLDHGTVEGQKFK